MQQHLIQNAYEVQRKSVGVVVPVYFPSGSDQKLGEDLLRDTSFAYTRLLEDSSHVCLSVDGSDNGLDVANDIAKECGARVVFSKRNRGKLGAIRQGVAALWEEKQLAYFVEVDADGDHFANELLNLVRAAVTVQARSAEEVLVIGRRTSKHRPMGFLRGELEELADRVLLDALYYQAAHKGCPLSLEYANPIEEYPDFHSGFKLFSRGAAKAAFIKQPKLCNVTEDAYYRHGCEAVMSVEPLLAGARLILVNRSTFNEQPITTFGLLDRGQMIADKIIWPCKRMEVPGHFVEQWLLNHFPRLQLCSLVPQGKSELLEIRRLVLEAFGIDHVNEDTEIWGPVFV